MNQPVKAPWHLWAIGIVTLLWNAIGIMSYMMTRLDMLDQLGMTPDQIAYFATFPAWANALWALGVWGAFLGSVLLLARSRWAVPSLMVSVVGLVGTTAFQNFFTQLPEGMSNPAIDIAIWVITLFMLWYAHRMRGQGVLG
jgi:hypothetical protein